MTGTEKQIKYAESLKAQTVGEFQWEIDGLNRMIIFVQEGEDR